jgi:hypothetical protein
MKIKTMKNILKLTAVACCLGLCATGAKAQSASTPTATDSAIAQAWSASSGTIVSEVSSSFTFTAATFYDGINGALLYGGTAEIYRPANMGMLNYFSADFSLITTASSGSHVLPGAGVMLHVNDLLADKEPALDSKINALPSGSAILSKAVVGAWFTRDFYEGKWRGGPYAGFVVKY